MKTYCLSLALCLLTWISIGQSLHFSPHQPVRDQDIMWKKTVWRHLDLQATANIQFSAGHHNLAQCILDYVRQGALTGYVNDSLNHRLSSSSLMARLEIPGSCDGLDQNDNTQDSSTYQSCRSYYRGNDLTELEIKEAFVFDKQHSRMVIQPIAITIMLSESHPLNVYGYQIPIVSIDFIEFEALEKRSKHNGWFNPFNEQENITFSQAIHLRKYHGKVVKINNPWNEYLDEYMSPEQAYWAGVNIDNQLREYEYGLWVDHP